MQRSASHEKSIPHVRCGWGGTVGFPEFEKGIDALGLPISSQQSKTLFASFDDSGDGQLDAMEFARKALGLDEEDGKPTTATNSMKKRRRKKTKSQSKDPDDIAMFVSRPRPRGIARK